MSTATAPPKNRYLQALSNVDLAHRNKKVITTPTRPPTKSRVAKTDAPIAVLFPGTAIATAPTKASAPAAPAPISITDDIPLEKPTKSSRIRKVYSKDFLLKFKYAFTDFPADKPTPQQIITQYNKDFEAKERQAALQEAAMASSASVVTPSIPAILSSHLSSTPTLLPTAATPAKSAKDKVREKSLKLKIPTSPATSRLPMFASKQPLTTPTVPTPSANNAQDDKENAIVSRQHKDKSVKSTPIKKQKTSAVSTKVSATTPTPIVKSEPVHDVSATTPAPTPAPAPEPATATDAIEDDSEPMSADSVSDLAKKMKTVLRETDDRRLSQRQKQIEYGKNTDGYRNYLEEVPRAKRTRLDPKTPNKHQICSKRSWDGQIRKWRRMLHLYDPNAPADANAGDDVDADEPLDVDVDDMDVMEAPRHNMVGAPEIMAL